MNTTPALSAYQTAQHELGKATASQLVGDVLALQAVRASLFELMEDDMISISDAAVCGFNQFFIELTGNNPDYTDQTVAHLDECAKGTRPYSQYE